MDMQTSKVTFKPETMGFVTCMAENGVGHSEITVNVTLNDLDQAIIVWSSTQEPIIANEELSIVCGASAFIYTEPNWYKSDIVVENSTGNFLW